MAGHNNHPVNTFEQQEPTVSTASGKIRRITENNGNIARLVGGNLTTLGSQYNTFTTQSTGITSNTSALKTAFSSTINFPGLEGLYIDEFEAGLTVEFKSTAVAATTVGYLWQMKNSTGSTWTNITAVETTKGSTTTTPTARTVSGYRLYRDSSLSTGYNKLPINLRLRFFAKSAASAAKIRVKNSSYVAVKPR